MKTLHPVITRQLRQAGFELLRHNKHEIYGKGDVRVTVPVNLMSPYTAKQILKQAGLV